MYETLKKSIEAGKINREQLIELLVAFDVKLKVVETKRISNESLKKLAGSIIIIK